MRRNCSHAAPTFDTRLWSPTQQVHAREDTLISMSRDSQTRSQHSPRQATVEPDQGDELAGDLVYDPDDEAADIGGGDPQFLAQLFAGFGDNSSAARGRPPAGKGWAEVAVGGASSPVKPGLVAQGARPSAKDGSMPNPYVALVELVLGGGTANAPRNKWEADHAEKSYSDTDHLIDLVSAGASAMAGGATYGALGRSGMTVVGAGAGAGAVGGLTQRATGDLLHARASDPVDYVRDAMLGAVLGAGLGALGTIGESSSRKTKAPPDEKRDVGLSDRGVRPGPGERATTREEYKAREHRERTWRRGSEADQPLDPGKTPDSQGKSLKGHGHGDHGHQVTPQQQGDRIRTRITPSGRTGRAISAPSSFGSPEAEAEALKKGRAKLEKALKDKTIEPFANDPEPTRFETEVESGRKEGFGRREVKAKGPDGKTLKDANGKIQTRTDPKPLRRARVVFEYVPSAREWRLLTYYPVE